MKLETDGVGKRYGDGAWGVRDVSLELDAGIHGLLGPNGAGKSTLMQMLTTVMEPTEGTVYWNGDDAFASPDVVRSVLGYLPQDFGVYPDLTLVEFLNYVATLRGLDSETASARIEELIQLTNLVDARDQRLKTFSGGMRQRAGIAQALVNDPELLVVDEPTVGLDPAERARFRNVLSGLAEDRVVLLSTHIVPDVEATATDVAVLTDGALLTHTDPAAFTERVAGDVYEYVAPRADLADLRERYAVSETVQTSEGVRVRVVADERPAPDADPVEPTLEDAYLATLEGEARA